VTPRQIALIRQSWVKVQPVADKAAKLFYDRLFETRPELQPMFGGDRVEQGRQLMTMLSVLIHGLERIDSLATVQELGARHARYGVRPEHYDAVGEALLWTLERGLATAFTGEVKEAWLVFYRRLAVRMSANQSINGSEK
jgi:hemoglobin-like flavoprotein